MTPSSPPRRDLLFQALVQALAEPGGQLKDAIVRDEHDNIARRVEHCGTNLTGLQMLVDLGAQFRVHLTVDVGGDVLPNVFAVDPHLDSPFVGSSLPALTHPKSLLRVGANPLSRGASARCKSARAR